MIKISQTVGEVALTWLCIAKADDQTIPSFLVHMPLLYLKLNAMQGLIVAFLLKGFCRL
ncbi:MULTISPECIES: hypothetical protein [unclassified Polynucleobacter]|uniref:hypothetical protein n=1 Tax=unclassified Polynucleobacter TaxID=2640945 RepID=UPI001F1F0183|nr:MULTISPECIES: hypothetical protein [unclassified Polynucleobacter]